VLHFVRCCGSLNGLPRLGSKQAVLSTNGGFDEGIIVGNAEAEAV
jgi:hypothetical protein